MPIKESKVVGLIAMAPNMEPAQLIDSSDRAPSRLRRPPNDRAISMRVIACESDGLAKSSAVLHADLRQLQVQLKAEYFELQTRLRESLATTA